MTDVADAGALVVAVDPPAVAETVYPVTVDPPSDAGGVHDTRSDPGRASTEAITGTCGTDAGNGTVGAVGLLDAEVPPALVAVTTAVYATPVQRPSTKAAEFDESTVSLNGPAQPAGGFASPFDGETLTA